MSLAITFHRATSAEFIEASVWYESKRLGLALEFMAEIDRCVSLAAEHPIQFAVPELLLIQNVSNGAACPVRLLSPKATTVDTQSKRLSRHFAAIKHF